MQPPERATCLIPVASAPARLRAQRLRRRRHGIEPQCAACAHRARRSSISRATMDPRKSDRLVRWPVAADATPSRKRAHRPRPARPRPCLRARWPLVLRSPPGRAARTTAATASKSLPQAGSERRVHSALDHAAKNTNLALLRSDELQYFRRLEIESSMMQMRREPSATARESPHPRPAWAHTRDARTARNADPASRNQHFPAPDAAVGSVSGAIEREANDRPLEFHVRPCSRPCARDDAARR